MKKGGNQSRPNPRQGSGWQARGGPSNEEKKPKQESVVVVSRPKLATHIEVSPAILRTHWEGIKEDWDKVYQAVDHVQIDVTDAVFAGDGTFRELREFKKLPQSEKIELHMMVQRPSHWVDDIIDLSPARVVFHLEAFVGGEDMKFVFSKLRESTQALLGLAINPETPTERLEEHLGLIDYVLFMGYNPGREGQPINPMVFPKIGQFHGKYPDVPIAVDGSVKKETIEDYAKAGASWFAANTAIYGKGEPVENIAQLTLLAEAAA